MGTFMCVNWKKNYKKNERKLQEQRPRYQIIFRPLNGDRVPSHCASCHRNALILWTVECAVRRVHFFDTVFGCVFTSFPRGLFFSQSTFSTHTHKILIVAFASQRRVYVFGCAYVCFNDGTRNRFSTSKAINFLFVYGMFLSDQDVEQSYDKTIGNPIQFNDYVS